MNQLLLVAIGGALGSSLRYATGILINKYIITMQFWSTITVNVIGAFFMGMAFAYIQNQNEYSNFKLFVMIGILGGFTTFSSYSLELLQLIKNQQFMNGLYYLLIMNVLTLTAVFLGYYLLKK